MEKKMKRIPFDLGTAKRITNKEQEGRIVNRDGKPVKIIYWNKICDSFPLIALHLNNEPFIYEDCCSHTIEGKHFNNGSEDVKDLFIEVPDTTPECPFKTFDKVLARDYDDEKWRIDLFSHVNKGGLYVGLVSSWRQCIHYEGNEHLLYTTNKPKED